MTLKPVPSLWLLSLASSLSPFGMVVLVPTLGAFAQRYAVAQGEAQFLIATYLFGLGIGQPVLGALSDRYGRRPVILCGFALFTVASIACFLATSFPALLLCRLLQAIGVSVGTVGSRAIVRDTHDALGAVRVLSWIGAAMGIAPVVGPVIGGFLTGWAGPQSVFAASAALGAFVTVAMYARLAETRDFGTSTTETQRWTTSYRQLLGDRVFMGYTLMYAFMQGCFFAFLAVAAVVFSDHLGMNEVVFGAIWGAMGIVYVAGALSGTRLTAWLGVRKALRLGTGLILLSGLSLAIATAVWGVTLSGLLAPLTLLMYASGVQTPLAVAGAVNCRPDIAGTAGGLSSSLALVISGSFSILAGLLYAGDFLPIAALIAASAGMSAVTYRMAR
ncbi:MAG: Bcr/CflA family efflux MFS transporter [Chromatiales bacterium]|nr:MAG: Bcr/CflA family efflux MFS transporter [Chromatiales bacterium]